MELEKPKRTKNISREKKIKWYNLNNEEFELKCITQVEETIENNWDGSRGEWGWLGHFSLFLKYHRTYLRYTFRIDTTRKGNPSSTNIINKLYCHFIRCDRIRCQQHVVELSQPTPSRGRLGQYTGHVGTVLKVCVLRAHSQ